MKDNALQLAASPLATPIIVRPAGVAAILIGATLAPEPPGILQSAAICPPIMLAMDFLVMFSIDRVSGKTATVAALERDTKDYFMRFPGYDSLRLLLAKRGVLVDGHSDGC